MKYEVIVNGRTVFIGRQETAEDTFAWYLSNKTIMKISEVIIMCPELEYVFIG